MKFTFDWRCKATSTVLAAALAAWGCAALAPKADHYVPPPIGSTWVSLQHNTGSFGSGNATVPGKRGERVWHGEKVVTFEGPEGTLVARLDGDWAAVVRGDTPIVSWNPPLNWDWPLEVGKTWTKSSSITIHAAKRTIPFSYTGKVEAYEDVTVPAGTFKAFRVHQTNTLGEEETNWLSPELGIFIKRHMVRTAKSASGPGTRDVELASQNILK